MKNTIKKVARCSVVFVLFFSFIAFDVNATNDMVAFNTQTYKVHKLSCIWAVRCTKNCIAVPRTEAYKRGGVPCKVCGG